MKFDYWKTHYMTNKTVQDFEKIIADAQEGIKRLQTPKFNMGDVCAKEGKDLNCYSLGLIGKSDSGGYNLFMIGENCPGNSWFAKENMNFQDFCRQLEENGYRSIGNIFKDFKIVKR